MRLYVSYIIILLSLSALSLNTQAQSRTYFDTLQTTLDSLTKEQEGLAERVDFGVSGVSVREFLRSLAENHELNFSISNEIDGRVANNFTNAKVADVIFFVCKENNLRVEVYGSILAFYPIKAPKPEKRMPTVQYNQLNGFLSLDLKQDTIADVVSEITDETGINLLFDPGLSGKKISAFIKNRPFENALDLMAEANGIKVEKKSERVYFLKPAVEEKKVSPQLNASVNPQANNPDNIPRVEALTVNEQGLISVRVQDANINDLLFDAALKTNHRYFLYTPVQGKVSTYIDNVNFEEFITYLFSGTEFSGVKDEGVYFIGKRNQEILRTTELVKLEHRTIETVIDFIPSELKKGVEIKEFIELNGLILSGSRPNIAEIKRFLASIDQVVPVIKIDVLIVDVTKNATIEAGIDMSLGGDNVPSQTTGKLNPGVDMTLNSSSINEIIRSFNGLGVVNLGQVTSDFYANIKALEANGILKLRSTPMLATLNGHEAELSIGNTEYYLETQANTITSQTPIQQQTQQFTPVNADLTVNIKPIVSSGDNVTLEISVSQSDFTARIGDTGPPGSVDRNFKSYIRVLNGEMILLGGLEEKSKEDSGSGLPLLSRIPVIKWLFSSRTKTTRKSQLNIFIRPTVIYQ